MSTVHSVGLSVLASVRNTNCHGVGLEACIAANPGRSPKVGHCDSVDSTGEYGAADNDTIPRDPGACDEKKYGGPAGAVEYRWLLAAMDMSHGLFGVEYARDSNCTVPGY